MMIIGAVWYSVLVYQKKFAGVQNIGQQVSHSTKFYTVTNFLWGFCFLDVALLKKNFTIITCQPARLGITI